MLIKVYTSTSEINKKATLYDNDTFFDNRVNATEFTELEKGIIEHIDKAKIINANIGEIETPFGICSIKKLSTGCKTVLNYVWLSKHKDIENYKGIKYLYATECGWNALEELFKTADKINYDIGFIIEHSDGLYNCSKRDYLIDGIRDNILI